MVNMVIYAKPFSINKVYYNNKAHGKTISALEWSYNVLGQIHNYGDELAILNAEQKAANCGISDLSNVEKILLDLLMLSNYHGENVPYTARNLNLDDCWVTSLHSRKVAGDEYKIEITMGLDT
jgi:hypothetical protein